MKVPRTLQPLVRDGMIDEVIRPLMAGKEAAVYLVVAHGEVCCAKVYKDAAHRSFRQRADYQEGRRVRNSRRARAMQRGTRFGKRQLEDDWQNAEVRALYRLADAGVRVPRPLNFTGGVLIMELIADQDGNAAPRLNDIALRPETARSYHQSLLRDVIKMLCAGLIHGDLSEYNVLVDATGPVIIDLPQAVDAAANNNAQRLLRRDVDNLAAYFSRFAPELGTADYGREIWQLYEKGKLHPATELTGRYEQPAGFADVGSVLADIDDARREAQRRRPQAAVKRKGGKGDEAWRGRVPEALPDVPDDPFTTRLIVSPGGGRKIVDLRPPTAPKAQAAEPAKKKRRRRRRRGGNHGPGTAPPHSTAKPGGPPADAVKAPPKTQPAPAQKPRRRRRRRRRQEPAAD